jgi:hypothetical protein
MPFATEVQQLIKQVEELSERPVHVTEEPGMKLRATVTPARGNAPGHMVRFKPGSSSLDYLVASQLVFLVRTFTCPATDRWEIAAFPEEQDIGIKAMGLDGFADDFARMMIGQIITQIRSYSIGLRVDGWIWQNLPGLRQQQETEIRSQLSENERALSPETRRKFPKPLVDTNSAMNALYATFWSGKMKEPRFVIPYTAMGYRGKAAELQAIVDDIPDDPASDRVLVERWAAVLGLAGAYHFNPYSVG